jgi:stage V sporulation protein SpoVS
MTVRHAFKEVKAALVDDIDAIVRELFPDGYYGSARKYWMFKNPRRHDRNAGCWIYLRGPKAGGWCDPAGDLKGDVFQLIQLARGGSIEDARAWGAWRAGLDPNVTPEERQQIAAERDKRKEEREREAAEQLAKDRRRAQAIWLGGIPLAVKGERNPAAALAFRYLEKRGIDLSRLPRLPGCTRLLLEQKHIESGGEYFPALGSCVVDADHQFIALHRVFITPAGDKIPFEPVRKTWPDYVGGFIPIWDGGTGVSAKRQAERGELVDVIVQEGIEDGFAAAIGKPDCRVRAALSLSNLKNLPIFAGDDKLIVPADNDWGKPQARKQLTAALDALAERCRATGTRVFRTSSYVGKDTNDLMKGETT